MSHIINIKNIAKGLDAGDIRFLLIFTRRLWSGSFVRQQWGGWKGRFSVLLLWTGLEKT